MSNRELKQTHLSLIKAHSALDAPLVTPLRTVHLDVHIEDDEYFIDIHKIDKDKSIIDQIINLRGYGFTQVMLLLVVFCHKIYEGSQQLLFSNIFIPFRDYYGISNYQTSFVSSSLFFTFPLGSISSSFLSNKLGRKPVFLFGIAITYILTVVAAIAKNLPTFFIMRLLIGYLLGVTNPILLGILSEYLPLKFRSFFISNTVGCMFLGGSIYLNLIMVLFMPNFELENLSKVLFVLSFTLFFCIMFSVCKLNDSPRNLIMTEGYDEAFEILETMGKIQLSEDYKETIKNYYHQGVNKGIFGFSCLFNKEYKYTTIMLSINWFINAFLVFGPLLVITITLKNIYPNFSDNQILFKLFIISLISFPGHVVAGLLSEVKFFGRKYTILIGFLMIGIAYGSGVLFSNWLEYFVGIGGFGICLSMNINISFTCEIYPTKIRDIAIGYFYFIKYISFLLTHFFAIMMYNYEPLLPYVFCSVMGFIGVVTTSMIQHESHGKDLDTNMMEEDSSKGLIKEGEQNLPKSEAENLDLYY